MKSTAKYNPPEIRGEINYQFKGGSWIFEAKANNSIDRIKRSILNVESQSLEKLSTPEGLISNNKVIIGLAKTIFLDATDKYPKSICRHLLNKYSKYIK